MGSRLRNEWTWWAAALCGVALMGWLTLQGFAWNDYDSEVSGAARALIAGDVHGFLAQVPAYGGSLVLRAPIAGAVAALGGGELAVYRAMSIPGLLAVALLGVLLVRRLTADGRSTGICALVLALCVANPITIRALEIGHPEELLCAAFAIGAVLAALDARTILSAVLLGLAIATKSWAVLAIGPVLLALPGRRLLALAVAGAVALLVLAPLLLAGSHRALAAGASTGATIFQPWQLFWFLGQAGHIVIGGDGLPKPAGYRVPPQWLSPLTHPLIALLVIPLSVAWARVHRAAERFGGANVLLLLVLLLLLRCILDPWNAVYYELPFVLALLCWEALCRPQQPPVLALAASAIVWFTFQSAPRWLSPDMQCVFFLAWSLPLAGWLAREAFGGLPRRAGGAVHRARATRSRRLSVRSMP
ncbi:MAG TPA: hypothetical protein VHZ75_06025 [Solirubrobacteraceae bacterium]|nr:hypothetical protein [Solirubrobacteraceae bacterium]